MFAKFRKQPKTAQPTTTDDLARRFPGMLIIESDHIKVFLGDVGVMTTIYAKTKGVSKESLLNLVLLSIHTDRHHQIYV
jgi:hypothetical protein